MRDIAERAEMLLRRKDLDGIMEDNLLRCLKDLDHGNLVYPSAVMRVAHTDINSVYNALSYLASEGLLEEFLDVVCPDCRETAGYYKTIGEIPKELRCRNCGKEIKTPLKYAVVIYRVR